jgi:Tol biopolymer transport system component
MTPTRILIIVGIILAFILAAKLIVSSLYTTPEPATLTNLEDNNTAETNSFQQSSNNHTSQLIPAIEKENESEPLSSSKIAFVSERDGNQEIYMMNPDGSDQVNLTNSKNIDYMTQCSPDGTKIAFLSERREIYHSKEHIVVRMTGNDYVADIPTQSSNTYKDLNLIESNSPKTCSIVTDFGNKPFYWRNDNEITYIDEYGTICSIHSNGANKKTLKDGLQHIGELNWSSDGNKIAYGCNNVYIWYSESDIIKKLTNFPYCELCNGCQVIRTYWSPDNSKIAFLSVKDSNSEIYIINEDGTNLIRLTSNAIADTDPEWSPDGSKIAFCSNGDIHIIDINTMQDIHLTEGTDYDSEPAWSPDGLQIAFTSESNNTKEIYIITIDGGKKTQLTDKGDNYRPQWCFK